jgi:hypothetical protein
VRKIIIAAAIRNPYAGRFSQDLGDIVGDSPALGEEFGRRIREAAGGRPMESYGKACLVGTAGEYEHGNAFLTAVFADPVREAVGGGKAWVPSTGNRGAPGTVIDVPLAHKDALYVRSHYDTVTVSFTDTPNRTRSWSSSPSPRAGACTPGWEASAPARSRERTGCTDMAADPTVTGRDHFTTLSGLRAHYVVWGDPARPAIVMLHGLRSYARTFDSLAGRLAGRYHVLAADARGRGDSDWDPQGQYDTESYVADLEEIADRLGLVRFILLGHSMGGATACVYAARHPERVIAAVIEDIGPGSSLSGEGAERVKREVAGTPAGFPSLDAARTSRARPLNPGCGTPWPKTARAAGAGNSTWRASPPPASTRIRPARWICGRTSRP